MKAIQLENPRQFRSIETEAPTSPKPGEALVRVHRVGICGTDYSGYLGKMPFYTYPRIPGHELGVEVLAVGEGVSNVQSGDLCSVEPYINCQNCFSCLRGNGNCCENLKVLGVMMDGGLRERLVLPARKLHASARLAPEQLALVETLAIGCHSVDRGQPVPGENALIIGAGPIGLAALEFIKLSGARSFIMDMNDRRLSFCREKMGADETVLHKGDGSELDQLERLTDGQLPTLVIDATGNIASMSNALKYVGFTGRLVYVGIATADLQFPHPLMHRREMTLYASRNAQPSDFDRIIKLIEQEQIDTVPWITHRTGFDNMIEEFPKWLDPETGVVKAMVNVTDLTT